MISTGLYKHYKGGTYKVHFTALDKDNDVIMVVYESVVHGSIYVRPLSEFTGYIVHEGNRIPRYVKA
jgi:hypothetical protein